MRPRQIWFGDAERPLAGRYYLPEDKVVRGAVVICPALGMEAACSAPALRELARELCEVGLAVLFFDYDGTGDSSGNDRDPQRVTTWQASIHLALDFLRAQGHEWLAVVGLRLGALLAAGTLGSRGDADALVLWDPCLTGRSFLREQHLLLRTFSQEPEVADGTSHGPGVTFSAETSGELREISLSTALSEIDTPVLLLIRSDGTEAAGLARAAARPGLHCSEIFGQFELVGVEPALARIPHETLRMIAAWTSTQARGEAGAFEFPESSRAVVATTTSGRQISEYPVRIGEDELFGMVTEPSVVEVSTSVIFLNAGVLDHIGPSRLWVELSRRWAAMGVRTLRLDISGVGESPYRTGMNERVTRSVHGLRQVREALWMMSPDDPSNVVLVGLCSGAYQAMEAGLANHVRAILMVNPAFRIDPLEEPSSSGVSMRLEVAERPRRWYRAMERAKPLVPLARRAPDVVWKVVNRFGFAASKSDSLVRLATAGIDTLVVTDPQESAVYQRGQKSRLRRLGDAGKFSMVVFDPLDHTVFGPLARQRVADALTQHLERKVVGKTALKAATDTVKSRT